MLLILLLIFFVIIFITIKLRKTSLSADTKGISYKSIAIIFLIITGLLLWTCFILTIQNNKRVKENAYTSKSNGFVIDYYKARIDVNERQVVSVNEDIGIRFYESGHHGIYRTIPEWLPYTNKEMNTVSRKAIISNINVKDEQFSLSSQDSKMKITIGDPNKTLIEGLHPYNLSYDYDLGPDEFSGYDEFIFHLYGNYWGTDINNAYVEIHMPKSFDGDIHFYSDKYRVNDITKYIDYSIEDGIIYAKVKDNYTLRGALTVDLVLPDGYFENSVSTYGYGSLLCCIICVIIAVGLGLMWYIKGKDQAPEIVQGSYEIPDNLDPAEIGFIYKKEIGPKLVFALILQLAVKGLVKIEDTKSKAIITRKFSDNSLDNVINRKVTFKLVRDYNDFKDNNDNSIKDFCKKYLNKKDNVYTVDSDIDNFLKDSENLVKENYIVIEKDTINDVSADELNKLKEEREKERRRVEELSDNEKFVYKELFFDGGSTCVLSENFSLRNTYNELSKNITEKFYDVIYDVDSYKYMLYASILSLLNCVLFLTGYWKIEDLHPSMKYMYIIAVVAVIVSMVFTSLMGRKSKYGESLVAKIDNFRKHITYCNVDTFKELHEDYNSYAYSLIPYAYVLNVSKQWSNKFKDIPEYKDKKYYLWDDSNYTDVYQDFSYSATHNHSSFNDYTSGGGCSSCGGGCSSCGGGCSSCGGGGSW